MPQYSMIQTVARVSRATKALESSEAATAIEALLHHKVEACSKDHGNLIQCQYHPVVAAVYAAFNDHRPIVFSPDIFWLLIVQGFARYVNSNAQKLRSQFVNTDSPAVISVRRDDFVKGSKNNPWPEVFAEFSSQIKTHIGESNHSTIVTSFSTTGEIEKAANEIVLMESMKSYFQYEFSTLCGIPEVKLEGKPEDWKELCNRTKKLGDAYSLTWWTDIILARLEEIADNAAGQDNPDLWNDVFKINNMSGGPYFNGWLLDFFPYLQTPKPNIETSLPNKIGSNDIKNLVIEALFGDERETEPSMEVSRENQQSENHKNPYLGNRTHKVKIKADDLPGGLSVAPFKWMYLDQQYDMSFVAGFIGYSQNNEDLALRPEIGWAVCETSNS